MRNCRIIVASGYDSSDEQAPLHGGPVGARDPTWPSLESHACRPMDKLGDGHLQGSMDSRLVVD
jgi:hypothetical protein